MRVSPEGMLSLHIAAAIGFRMRVLELIVKMAPQTLWSLDNKKMRPLHCFCEKGHQGPASGPKCLEKMQFLREGKPNAVAAVDVDGYSPIHLLVVSNASFLLVHDCVQWHPLSLCRQISSPTSGVSTVSDFRYTVPQGSTPLHLALHLHMTASIVQSLVNGNPDALFLKDAQKQAPLHAAVECGSSEAVLKELITSLWRGTLPYASISQIN